MNPPAPQTTTLSSLTTALSSLTTLLHNSSTTLHRVPIPTTTTLLPCLHNPNHHLPPNSLFNHHLTCPTPTDNLTDHNFFYRNCPSPVTVTPTTRPPPVLILPRILSLECGSFDIEPLWFPGNFITLLPSEVWAVRSEIEAWSGGGDVGFSIRVLRAVLRLRDCELSRFSKWVVVRSADYGVVIDFLMRDHVVLLVRLCLRAVVREAFGLVGFLFGGGGVEVDESERFSNLSGRSFNCPVFREVLGWLGSQLGLLYGEVNGRLFAVEVLKECIVDSALSASLFAVEEMNDNLEKVSCEEPGERTLSIDDCKVKESEKFDGQTVGGSVISISQVAAAVTALYERSLIEEKIRASRDTRPLSAYQRNMEHSHVSKIAEEERRKRTDYRPIIEHDSLLWHRSRNQDTNKVKTREELLAEERDYKRRRMSYRGKKSKRSTIEVMRDIIEDYMEEIKQSAIMSSTSETVKEAEVENKHLHDYKNNQSSSHDYHDLQDLNRNVNIFKHDRDDYLERPDLRQSGSHSRGPPHRERRERSESKSHEENYHKTERHECEYNNRKRERDEDDREYRESGRKRTKRDDRERNEDYSRHKDRERRKTNRNSSSRHERYNEFEDRYDPSDSREES